MQKFKKKIAFILMFAMILTSGAYGFAYAATEQTVSNSNDSANATSELTQANYEEADGNLLSYFYIETTKVETSGTQNIVVSFADNAGDVSDVKLQYSKDKGDRQLWESTKNDDGAFLFTKDFDSADKGSYKVLAVTFVQDGTPKIIKLKDAEKEAYFGVDMDYKSDVKPDVVLSDGTVLEDTTIEEVEVNGEIVQADITDTENISTDITQMLQTQAPLTTSESQSFLASILSKLFVKSTAASNIVIVLDPGHDSEHAGARGNGLKEEEITLKIAQYCKAELEKYGGVTVYLTRTTASCPFPNSKDNIDDIKQRVKWAKSKGADAFVSIHLNSYDDASVSGAEVYYHSKSTSGKALAQKIQDQLKALGLKNRGIKINDAYAVINTSQEQGFPGIIVEHAFISNASDASNFLKTASGQQKLGVADAKGIANYFGLQQGKWVTVNGKARYQYSDGSYAKGYANIGGKYYYFDSEGYQQNGHQMINGKPYQFYCDKGVKGYGYPSGWIKYSGTGYEGKKGYSLGGGQLVTGTYTIDGTQYYFDADGFLVGEWEIANKSAKFKYYSTQKYATGYVNIGGKYYYFDSEGYQQNGHQMINGKPYQFYCDKGVKGYGYPSGWIKYSGTGYEGKYAYSTGGGALNTGYVNIGGKYYYFDSEGYQQNGHQMINGKPYQFYCDKGVKGYGYPSGWIKYSGTGYEGKYAYSTGGGALNTGYVNIGGKYYYFDSEGYQQNGHQMINGKPYQFYCDKGVKGYGYPSGWIKYSGTGYEGKKGYSLGGGQLVTGTKTIDSKSYTFDSDGFLVSQTSKHPITGQVSTTAKELAKFYDEKSPIGYSYSEYYKTANASKKDTEATTLEKFCQIYVEEAKAENINVDVAFCQAMHETGWLQYKGDVSSSQFNFAGLGATGNKNPGNSFANVRTGIRAQIQHLKAYANKDALKNACVDVRFQYVTRGSAPYVEDLGGKWAVGAEYGTKIVTLMKELNSSY